MKTLLYPYYDLYYEKPKENHGTISSSKFTTSQEVKIIDIDLPILSQSGIIGIVNDLIDEKTLSLINPPIPPFTLDNIKKYASELGVLETFEKT
ncbi:MAG: hypothetical protein QXW86_11195 [Saccharolobus sp.]|nr:hypothetical protein [Saccharolobus shibatae]MCH4815126.1 hypothetical protein [Saccharolobus shibatae]